MFHRPQSLLGKLCGKRRIRRPIHFDRIGQSPPIEEVGLPCEFAVSPRIPNAAENAS